MKYSKYLLWLFVFFSFITHPIGGQMSVENLTNPLKRMTLGDLAGFGGIFLFILANMRSRISVPELFKYAILFLFCLAPGILVSSRPFTTFFEIFILSFLIIISVCIYNTHKKFDNFISLLKVMMITTLCCSIVGIYDLVAGFTSLPFLFKPRMFEADGITQYSSGLVGEAKSGFRNAGQAGAYMLHMLTILLPIQFSKLKLFFNKRWNKLLRITLLFSVIFLFITFKVSALIGMVVGVFFYSIFFRNTKFIFGILVFILLGVAAFPATEVWAPKFYNRVIYKFDTRIAANAAKIAGEQVKTKKKSFIEKNIGLAMLSFKTNPLFGSGIGAFSGRYGKHEVHSTPFKLVGETGILGIIGYLFLITVVLIYFVRAFPYTRDNPFRQFLLSALPFFFGCMVSWGYTWHIRKRSFWIILMVIAIASYMMAEWHRNKKLKHLIAE